MTVLSALELAPLAWLSSFVLLLPLSVIFYRLYLHPLASVPGPKLAAISNLWYAHKICSGKDFELGLHEKYGPAVRLGPNTVIFNSKEAFDLMYRAGSGFEKADFYSVSPSEETTFWEVFYGRSGRDSMRLLNETNMERYRQVRRLIGGIYSSTNMRNYEMKVHKAMDRICERLRKLDGKEVRMAEWMHIIVAECVGELVLSSPPPRMLEEGTDFGQMESGLWESSKVFSLLGVWPLLGRAFLYGMRISTPLRAILSSLKKPTPSADSTTFSTWPWIMKNTMAGVESVNKDDWTPREDIFSQLISLHKAKPEFNLVYLRDMNLTNFGAGDETMTSALTSVLSRISSDPELQREIEAECRHGGVKLAFEEGKISTSTGAAVREAMRLHVIANAPLLRKSPASGASLHGHYLPPGTQMGCNGNVLHRNPAVYGEDAGEFKPRRWLQGDEAQLRAMDRVNLVWGGANRSCPGQNFAKIIMAVVVPRLFKEFDIKVSMSEGALDDMPPFFVSMLWGPMVSLTPRK